MVAGFAIVRADRIATLLSEATGVFRAATGVAAAPQRGANPSFATGELGEEVCPYGWKRTPNGTFHFSFFIFHFAHQRGIEFAEVLAVGWQLVVFQIGQHLPELKEEALAWLVAVGIHVIFS